MDCSVRVRISLVVVLLVVTSVVACGGDDGDGVPAETASPTVGAEPGDTTTSAEDVVITIGRITDLTGPSAGALATIEAALDDLVEYYNEEDLIPGVELKVIRYDTSYDPSKYIAGYQWLMERGVDLLFAPVPGATEIIRPRMDENGMILFSPAAIKEDLVPPGNVFMPATIPEDNAYTLLKWLAEHDPDFPKNRPARVGAAGWFTPYNIALHDAMEEYSQAHTDQFEWMGQYQTERSFTWGPEVHALKDCDYVMVPIVLNNFVKEYRNEGYTAKFIGTAAQAGFLGLISDAGLWEEIDGMVFVGLAAWWGDGTEVSNFIEEILYRYRASEAEEFIRQGSGYGAVDGINQMMEIIADAVKLAGPAGFESSVLYEAATSYTQTTSTGEVRASFTETKRASIDRLAVYVADGAAKDLVMVTDEMTPVLHEP